VIVDVGEVTTVTWRWPELVGLRVQAGELIGDEDSGLTTAG
jgi:hypothetical protein